MKRTFAEIFWHSAKQTPKLYFAPLVGAVRGAVEYTRLQYKLAAEEDAIFFGKDDEPALQKQGIEQAG
ncbi:hypothetical protein LJR289_002374 [Pseudoduganella sp. LjRoot289]|uniref:hypothetical protein n=1 Tax=Pseudoduganella sp. LjRoot289 TaxID=3342314 RepID=UPI003ECE5FBE